MLARLAAAESRYERWVSAAELGDLLAADAYTAEDTDRVVAALVDNATRARCYHDVEVALHPLTEMRRSPRPDTVRPLVDLLDSSTTHELVEYVVHILAEAGSTELDRASKRHPEGPQH